MTHTFHRIPDELKALVQWIVWRYEESEGKKPTKVPYSPLFKTHADVQKPATWATFDEAVAEFEQAKGQWNGIGFVFTRDDEYSGIDLDDTEGDQTAYQRQLKIFEVFQSYTELSPSGTGIHIIVKGKVDRGRRRSKIEIYPHERFFTMTGNVYRDLPINEHGEALQLLYNEMGGPADIHDNQTDQPEREDDATVMSRMFEAVNGDKARDLYEGRYDTYYESQSEADFALVDIIAFYTQNRFQIVRIFHTSALGQRDKAKRIDYMYRMINRAFDRQLPPIDTEAFRIAIDDAIAAKAEAERKSAAQEGPNAADTVGVKQPGAVQSNGSLSMAYDPARVNPPGLVGEIADFIYAAAPRPVYEIALAGAIGLVAAVAARAYNVSGTGLNQYIMLLAPTGTGKEAINRGISKLFNAVLPSVPQSGKFMGPGEIRSDAALLKWLSREQCILTIAGEMGLRLKQMSAPNANSHEIGLKKVLLDLYSKSGFGEQLNPMAYSDKDKNTDVIFSPCFTMIGESTPERFYEALDEGMIYEGLLPRFTFIEYDGPRPALNKGAWNAEPTFGLVEKLGALMAHSLQLQAAGKGLHVAMSSEADQLFDAFDKYCDEMWNAKNSNEIHKQLWTRAHVKAMRLAGTVAVGCDMDNPTIDKHTAQWATDLIVKDVLRLIGKFERGEVGETNPFGADEMKQLEDLIKAWVKIVRDPYAECAKKYGLLDTMHKDGVVTITCLSRYVSKLASFRKDRAGSARALDRALKHLLDGDEIGELPKDQCETKYGPRARSFAIKRPARFILE